MHWYLLLLIWFSLPNRYTSKEKFPPGTIKLENNLFVDKTEISSLEYREYLYWLKRIFGEDGKILKNAFPNTSVYDSLAKSFNVTSVEFIFQPQFANYPIVGVSFEQATNFCQWRSDRVFEMILVTNKIMEWDTSQNKATFFTIKKYHDQHPPKNKEEKSIRYPEYQIPNTEYQIPIPAPSSQLPAPSSQLPAPSSQLPAPCSLLPAPCSLFPAPCSLLPAPCSLLPAPCSLLPAPCYFSFRASTHFLIQSYVRDFGRSSGKLRIRLQHVEASTPSARDTAKSTV